MSFGLYSGVYGCKETPGIRSSQASALPRLRREAHASVGLLSLSALWLGTLWLKKVGRMGGWAAGRSGRSPQLSFP